MQQPDKCRIMRSMVPAASAFTLGGGTNRSPNSFPSWQTMNQIVSAPAAILDDLQRGLRHLQQQPGFDGLSLANTLVVVLVLVIVCWAVSLSLRSLFQRH